jgi:hypothetical protein
MNAIVLQDLLERCETPERRMRVVLRAAAGVDPAVLREFDGRWLELVTMEGGTPMIWLEWAWWLFRAAMITVGMWTSLNWIRDEIPRWRHRRYVWICGRIHEQGGRREFRSRFLFVARFRLWLHQSIRRCKPWPLEKPTEP